MLNTVELNRRRNRVLGAIDKLSVADALAVMGAAIRELAAQAEIGSTEAANDCDPSSVDLILEGENSRLKVEKDPEVRDFILSLRGPMSIEQMTEFCRKRFGERAPSKSALHRYLQALKIRRGTRG